MKHKILKPGVQIFTRCPGGNAWLGEVVAFDRILYAVRLRRASWVANTGRFGPFMAGRFDSRVEIETLPADMEVTVPLDHTEVTEWPHDLPVGDTP